MVNVLPGSEIIGVHDDRGSWRLSSSILLALIIAAIAIGILLFIYNIMIVNYVRTDRTYRVTRGMVVTATWLNYIAALFIGVTLIASAIYVSYVGYPRFRHHPRGYTLSEHHELIQGYMDVKASNMPEQVDVDRITTDNREDNLIAQLGGMPNVGVDLPDAYAGLPSLDGSTSRRSDILTRSDSVTYDARTGTYVITPSPSIIPARSEVMTNLNSPSIIPARSEIIPARSEIMGEQSVLEYIDRTL